MSHVFALVNWTKILHTSNFVFSEANFVLLGEGQLCTVLSLLKLYIHEFECEKGYIKMTLKSSTEKKIRLCETHESLVSITRFLRKPL